MSSIHPKEPNICQFPAPFLQSVFVIRLSQYPNRLNCLQFSNDRNFFEVPEFPDGLSLNRSVFSLIQLLTRNFVRVMTYTPKSIFAVFSQTRVSVPRIYSSFFKKIYTKIRFCFEIVKCFVLFSGKTLFMFSFYVL